MFGTNSRQEYYRPDSDGKYHILCCVSILEIITIFRIKPSYLKNIILIISYIKISFVFTIVNIYSIIIGSPLILSESLFIKMILFLYFKIYFYINILMAFKMTLNKKVLFYFSK